MEIFCSLKLEEDIWVEDVDLGVCQHEGGGLKLKSEQDCPGQV